MPANNGIMTWACTTSELRYLNVNTGRFWTMDSYEGVQHDPSSLHKYLYTGNDPINKIDPSGNISIVEAVITVGNYAILAAMATAQFVFAHKISALLVGTAIIGVGALRYGISTSLSNSNRQLVTHIIQTYIKPVAPKQAEALLNVKTEEYSAGLPYDLANYLYNNPWGITFQLPTQLLVLTRNFFESSPVSGDPYPLDDLERAIILLHESFHITGGFFGGSEKYAYEQTWLLKEAMGWTEDKYGPQSSKIVNGRRVPGRASTRLYQTTKDATEAYAPHLFKNAQ